LPVPPKPAERRQRRNKTTLAEVVPLSPKVPAAPEGLSEALQEQWRDVWTSQVGRAIQPHHEPALRRLFTLRGQFEMAMRVVEEQPMVQGSTGQPRANPMADYALRVDAAILRLENELGLTPLSQAKLGMAVGSAQLTLEELNRLAKSQASQTDDPRLSAVELAAKGEGPPTS